MSTASIQSLSPGEVVDRYIGAWHTHDPAVVAMLHTPDSVYTSAATGLNVRGREAVREVLTRLFVTWPDIHFEPQRTYLGGDVAFVESIIAVTQATPMTFAGIEIEPTGKTVQVLVADVLQLHDGLVAHKHSYLDALGYLRAMRQRKIEPA